MLKWLNTAILIVLSCTGATFGQQTAGRICFDFYGHSFNLQLPASIITGQPDTLSEKYIWASYEKANSGEYSAIVDSLLAYRKQYELNDWVYYQLVRKTAQAISPKKENYERYTFYKWFLMVKSGYDARLTISGNRIIFYVHTDEDISDIPYLVYKDRKYMCLNHHDYAYADLNNTPPDRMISIPEARQSFSYKVTRIPEFKPESYTDRQISFSYGHKAYHFNIKLNPGVQELFKNYPVVDFESYFNIPLSKETHGSLIPILKKAVTGMKQKKGVDYLMRFTRYAFLYEDDDRNYGREKRLSPEQTLFAEYSDCDDRAALFFYLVKEIYNLPMIALLYPTHITMAVQFDKPVGQPIVYKGKAYSICEPTPQKENLAIGELSANLKHAAYQVVYAYEP